MQGNLAQASAQEGFVSVDCGAPAGKYTDNKTSIEWMSDAAGQAAIFVSEGVSVAAPVQAPAAAEIKKYDANEAQRLSSVRYFPGGEQSKYCYVFSGNDFPFVQPHTALLVRAAFWAGNLTFNASAGTTNTFQLLINADIWDDVSIALPQSQVVVKEAYMLPASNTSPPSISVCLAGKGAGNMTGIPFVSSLELRLLPPDFYNFYSTYFRLPMHLVSAVDYGAATDETAIRFPDDPIDRIWQADTSHRPIQSTSREIATDVLPFAAPALHVLQTAYVQDEQIMLILPVPKGANYVYYVEMYIFDTSETQEVSKGQRVFALQATGYRLSDPIDLFDFRPLYYFSPFLGAAFPLRAEGDGHLNFTVTKAANSTYGPLINALQLFRDFGPLHPGSNGQDIDAISFLQTNHFKSLRRWSGDPCSPYPYNWLTCTADESPRVSNLLLSNRGLNGNMPTSINFLESLVEIFLDHNELSGPIPDLGKLQKLQTLDLSNNNFSGQIPTALANLPRLETLILDNNSFEGEVPQELLDKFLNPKFKLRCGEL
ncbi:hypothetical protein L7F22_051984 [Adiantum nelumboides]|nr:hypothetical protein [Adiantum nelumboides]